MAAAAPSLSHSSSASPSFHFDEKWKLSKKEGYPSRSTIRSSSSISPLMKSPSTNNNRIAKSHHKRCAFTRKCARLVKEQRARFYIMRRCVTMLICWRDYGDS